MRRPRDGGVIVLVVGKKSFGKGTEYVLGAMHRVHPIRPDVQWWFVGKGDEYLCPRALGHAWPWLYNFAPVHHDEMAWFYGKASLVVHGSLMEGAPRAVREAKAHGKFVIATDVGGTAECGPDVLVPPRDPVALADAILKALA